MWCTGGLIPGEGYGPPKTTWFQNTVSNMQAIAPWGCRAAPCRAGGLDGGQHSPRICCERCPRGGICQISEWTHWQSRYVFQDVNYWSHLIISSVREGRLSTRWLSQICLEERLMRVITCVLEHPEQIPSDIDAILSPSYSKVL